MGGGKVIELTKDEEFAEQLEQAASTGHVIIVDFSAVWCGPCGMISPYFANLSDEHTDIVFLKVDVDKLEGVAAQCGISAMPTFQVFKNKEKIDELVGASKDKLKALVEKYSTHVHAHA